MKKLALYLLLGLSFIFIGCNETSSSKENTTNVEKNRGLTPPPSIPTYKPKEVK